jgi:surfactin synthase thioesterase subunit
MTSRSEISFPLLRSAPTLICFPYAGGSTHIYQGWARHFRDEMDIKAVSLPGRSHRLREAPLCDWDQLLANLREELTPWLEVPHVLLGHSFGGRIAYEMAQGLESEGLETTQMVIVSGCRSPRHPQNLPMMHLLSDAEFLEAIGTMAGTPPEVLENPAIMRIMLPALRADMMLSETWVDCHEAPIRVPIHAIVGREDAIENSDSMVGWSEYTTSHFALSEISGTHFNISESPQQYLDTVREALRGIHVLH